ncbi:hypothetical protein TNCV_1571521 [Trichonephila clavipes]|uniref:Uncharacterized protein n=1 Tax=Trichonephila clavipes TaxID=2585209 RepID=A0A8X6SKY3_TRICX|nr:hypothetical protein TNCV_1571521 [Trichonephila clavipes]
MRRLTFWPKKEPLVAPNSLTYLELFSGAKKSNSAIWTTLPVHQWYQRRRLCGAMSLQCSRHEKTSLNRLIYGHFRSLSYSNVSKIFPACTKRVAIPKLQPSTPLIVSGVTLSLRRGSS